MSEAFMVAGFVFTVVGIGLWSVPAACVVAGIVLFVSGGLAARRTKR